jgi:hypothetical protein
LGISDIHLSFGAVVDPGNWDSARVYKPMDLFGDEWHEHYRKIYHNWFKTVGPGDVVLMPGDFSWARKLEEARYDLDFLGYLPGLIIGIAGNHDYWWQSLSQVRLALPPNMKVIQNDHVVVGDNVVCGTRGWLCPNDSCFTEKDLKIYRRELIRLENSLKSIRCESEGLEITVLMHFMPTNDRHERSEFIDVLENYGVKRVVYGHLHAKASRLRLPDTAWGINFHLVSADYVGFKPALIKDGFGKK